MTSRRALGLVVALGALLWPAVAAGAGERWPPREPLGVRGRWITDADGRVLVPRGMNMVDKRMPYVPGARGFGADDARFLRRNGFTAIRLGWIPNGLEPVQGAPDLTYVERFAADVRTAREAGLLVLVDLHQDYFNERTGGEGFPEWMTPVVGPPPRPDSVAFDVFWSRTDFQDAAAAMWGRIATRLSREPGILGYDLLNEPFPGRREQECAQYEGCAGFDRDVLDPFYARLAAAVRRADPARTVYVEPHVVFNSGAASLVSAPAGGPSGFSFHVYCRDTANPLFGVETCAFRRPLAFDNAEAVSRRTGMALLMSEFGATDDVAGELETMVRLADERMLPWLHWAYWNHDPFAARPHEGLIRELGQPPEGANVKADKLERLARPYPRAVAGTPRRWSWDAASRTFELVFVPQGSAPTEVVLPPTAFPAGWTATVGGGTAVGAAPIRTPGDRSRPVSAGDADGAGRLGSQAAEADVLVVEATPGAAAVTVRVVGGRAGALAARRVAIRLSRRTARRIAAAAARAAAAQRRDAGR